MVVGRFALTLSATAIAATGGSIRTAAAEPTTGSVAAMGVYGGVTLGFSISTLAVSEHSLGYGIVEVAFNAPAATLWTMALVS